MIHFTSDQHFGHENIIKHTNRPFRTVEEMDRYMVRAWNSVVRKNDIVYHLGDISHKRCDADRANDLVAQCNGIKRLIVGNHETDGDVDYSKTFQERVKLDTALFDWVNEGYHETMIDGVLIIMSHYALETWHDMSKKSIQLHGHSHGKLKPKTRRLDVGVDTHDFKPWSWDQIKVRFKISTGKAPVMQQKDLF